MEKNDEGKHIDLSGMNEKPEEEKDTSEYIKRLLFSKTKLFIITELTLQRYLN